MILRIGLTGGIGSGKSTVAAIFEVMGIPVYYADEAARRLMNENAELKKQIMALFGPSSYKNETLNRSYISGIVFQDPHKLSQLNAIVHPETIRDGNEWMTKQKTPYAIKEAALIFESDTHKHLDYVIGVRAPEELRIQRTMRRDGITREQVLNRMKNQMPEEEKMRLSSFHIVNDEIEPVLPQAIDLHYKLLEMAKHKAGS